MIRPRRPLALAAAVAATIGLAACGGESDSQRRPIGQQQRASPGGQLPEGHPEIPQGGGGATSRGSSLPPAVRARLDSGNTAYRAGDYEEALRHFRAATGDSAGGEAAWFGVYMAQKALGNDGAADSALQRAGALGESPSFHPSASDTTGADADAGGASTDG